MLLRLDDIAAENRNAIYVCNAYNVSKVSAWRLLSGKSSYICPGYRDVKVSIADGAWDVIVQPETMRHIRNCIAYQLKKWRREDSIRKYIGDIAQECYIRAYKKSGIWMDMPEEKKRVYLATLAKRTTNDIMKKNVHYTDTY